MTLAEWVQRWGERREWFGVRFIRPRTREMKIRCRCDKDFVIDRAMVKGAEQPTMQCPTCGHRYRLLRYDPFAGVAEFADAPE